MSNSAPTIKWYSTTGGKIGIFLGLGALITGVVLLVRKKLSKSESTISMDTTTPDRIVDQAEAEKPNNTQIAYAENDLPNQGVGCGDVKTTFDKAYDYVFCNGAWWTISKDKSKIPAWKNLSDNQVATNLLNNKYNPVLAK